MNLNVLADIKQYKKVFLLYFFILFLSCLIAPVIKECLDAFLPSNAFLTHILKFKNGSYDFGKVLRRIILVVAVLIAIFFRKPLKIRSFGAIGMKHYEGWQSRLQMGFLLGVGVFIVYTSFLCSTGVWILQTNVKSIGSFIINLFETLLIAGVVGCIEEALFRGFILQSFLQDMRVVSAVCVSSLFYSLLHFLKAKILVAPGLQPFIGFVVCYQAFKNIVVHLPAILPSVIGLFLIGVVLSYAYLRTRSLYFSIGLHAGWVFLIKTNGSFLRYAGTNYRWLYGDKDVITGLLGWVMLVVTLFLVYLVTKTSFDGKNTARIG